MMFTALISIVSSIFLFYIIPSFYALKFYSTSKFTKKKTLFQLKFNLKYNTRLVIT